MSLVFIKKNKLETNECIVNNFIFQFENKNQLTRITVSKMYYKNQDIFFYILDMKKYTKGKLEEFNGMGGTLKKARSQLKSTGVFNSNLY
jgi:hypothetical protein